MKGKILYMDNYEPLRPLSYEQKGRLLDAIFLYTLGEELPQMDAVTRMAFEFIRTHLDAAADKYEDVRRKRAEAGKRHKGNQYTLNGTNGTSVPNLEQMEQDGTNGTNGTNTITNTNTKTITKTKTKTTTKAADTATDGTSVPNYSERLKADEMMLIGISQATATPKDKLIALLPEFENQLYIDGKRHTNYIEYRKHFQMYASKKAEIERQQKTQDNGEFRTNTERRRGKAYDVSKIEPEDYKPF